MTSNHSTSNKTPHNFQVVGIDEADGSATELFSSNSSAECYRWHLRYISAEDAGGWDRIEILDMREECAERLWYWEREEEVYYVAS